jgi:hypothetical protein
MLWLEGLLHLQCRANGVEIRLAAMVHRRIVPANAAVNVLPEF